MIVEDILNYPTGTIHDLIEDARDTYDEARAETLWREYAMGEMRDMASFERKLVLGDVEAPVPQQNLIRICLDQIVGRIRFKKFVVDDKGTQAFLDELVAKNNLTRASVAVARRALTDGNASMSLSWKGGSSGRPMFHHETWYCNDGTGMFVATDEIGNIFWACSEFVGFNDVTYRTLYTDEVIIKYRLADNGWSIIDEIPWLKRDGSPLGVPVAHFPNGAPEYSPYSVSTVGGVIDVQDGLNASLFNRMAVSALTGSPIYWATGVGNTDNLKVGAGQLWSHPDNLSRFGVMPSQSMDNLLQESDDLRGVISGQFPVPSYRLGAGDWPSGLALQRSDGPMITKVRLLRDVIEPSLIYLAHRATEMANTFSAQRLNEEEIITVEWEPIDDIDPGTETEIMRAKAEAFEVAEGLTETSIRKLAIFDDDEIEALLAEKKAREEEIANAALATAGDDGTEADGSSW